MAIDADGMRRPGLRGELMFIFNRLAFSLMLIAFNSVLLYWVDTLQHTLDAEFSREARHGRLDASALSRTSPSL